MKKIIVALLVAALCMVAPVAAFDWDALPTNTEVWIDSTQPLGYAYFDIHIGNDVYPGWCVDIVNLAILGEANTYYADFSSTIVGDEKWNKVNWVLNNKGQATTQDIQAAIWLIYAVSTPG